MALTHVLRQIGLHLKFRLPLVSYRVIDLCAEFIFIKLKTIHILQHWNGKCDWHPASDKIHLSGLATQAAKASAAMLVY